MNFVFVSPHFPGNCRLFCQSLRNNNVNVLGIGDQEYASFSDELKGALTDYYKVSSLGNYDELVAACRYFTNRYGQIGAIESLNEHWLTSDACLRSEFNVPGMHADYLKKVKRKSLMKECYAGADVPFARHLLINGPDDLFAAKRFAEETGYPLVAKPDVGVGATTTFRLKDEEDLSHLLVNRLSEEFILEEFIPGNILTFDALVDRESNLLYATNHFLPVSLMDMVLKDSDVFYHSQKMSPDLLGIGQRTIKAFGIRERFVHLEFFRLYEDRRLLGKAGDIVGLEANLRPGGAYIPDMINYAADIDIYQMWADMVCGKTVHSPDESRYFCGYVGRKFNKDYKHSHKDILSRYQEQIVLTKTVEDIFVRAMGKYVYIFRSYDMEDINQIAEYIMAE